MTATVARPRPRQDDAPEPEEPTRTGSGALLVAIEVLLHLALVGLALVAYEPVFGSYGRYATAAGGAAIAATLLATLLRRRRVPARFSVLAGLVGVGLYLSYTVLVGELSAGVVPGPDTIRALRAGLGHGWQEILDRPLPVEDRTDALVWLVAVTWLAAHLTADLLQRTRLSVLPIVPSLVLFGLALPLISSAAEPSLLLTAALIAVSLIAVLVRAAPDSRTVRRTGASPTELAEFHSRSLLSARLRLGLPVVALAVIAAPLVGDLVTVKDPFDPRDLRNEIILPEDVADPLGQLKAQISANPPRAAFRVAFGSPGDAVAVRRVSVLHLDRYDGVRWTSTGRFGDAANPLADREDLPPGLDVTQRYTIGSTDDPWLPVAGQPLRTDLPNAAYDRDAGDLLATGTVSGLTYEVVSRVTDPTAEELAAARHSRAPGLDRYFGLEGAVPEQIVTLATEAITGAASTGDALLKLEQFLRSGYAYDDEAPAGHSYGRLVTFLTTDRRGTAEQFAAAYAVMARSLGYPTRVVVGYKVVEEVDGELRPLEFVTSADYHAWVEVRLDGLGWVAIDPTPRPGDVPLPDRPTEVPATTIAPQQPSGGQSTPEEAGPSEGLPEIDPTDDSLGSRVVATVAVVVGAVALIAAVVVLAIVVTKARRRRARRNAPTPADRVVGAWDEVVDRLLEMQFPIGSSMTPRDVERVGRATYGAATTEPLAQLVPAVSRAVFAQDEPTADAAELAWQRTEQFERNLKTALTRRQRIRTRLSLRPFRR